MGKKLKKNKIGVALSGGASKGLAHIYILKTLEENNIPIHVISGASAGAIIGAMYSLGILYDDIERLLTDARADQLISKLYRYINFDLIKVYKKDRNLGIFRTDSLIDYFENEVFKGATFEDCKTPFVCSTTNLDSGETEYINKGPLSEAVVKSMAFPIIFCPVNKVYSDGGIRENCPVNILKDAYKCDKVIAVDLKKDLIKYKDDYHRSFRSFIFRVIDIMFQGEVNQDIQRADIILTPVLDTLKFFDFQEKEKAKHAVRELMTTKIINDLKYLC